MSEPTTYQLITLAALCVGMAFLAGMLTYAMIRDAMDRKALRDAAAGAFFLATLTDKSSINGSNE